MTVYADKDNAINYESSKGNNEESIAITGKKILAFYKMPLIQFL